MPNQRVTIVETVVAQVFGYSTLPVVYQQFDRSPSVGTLSRRDHRPTA